MNYLLHINKCIIFLKGGMLNFLGSLDLCLIWYVYWQTMDHLGVRIRLYSYLQIWFIDTDGYYIISSCTVRQTTDKLVFIYFLFFTSIIWTRVGLQRHLYTSSEVQPSRLHYTDELIQTWNHGPKKRSVIDKHYILFYCLYNMCGFRDYENSKNGTYIPYMIFIFNKQKICWRRQIVQSKYIRMGRVTCHFTEFHLQSEKNIK